MAYSLRGSAGTVSVGTAGSTVTPAYGASATPVAGDVIVCEVQTGLSATLPAAISGWLVRQKAGTTSSVSHYYKVAAGSDAAPVIPAVTGAIHSARLLVFPGFTGTYATDPLDQYGSNSGTTSTETATANANDTASGELFVASAGFFYSAAATKTLSATSNNATLTSVNNGSTNTREHYLFAYSLSTTGNAAADTFVATFTTASITGVETILTSFLVSPVYPTRSTAFAYPVDTAGVGNLTSGSFTIGAQGDYMMVSVVIDANNTVATMVDSGTWLTWVNLGQYYNATYGNDVELWGAVVTSSAAGKTGVTITITGTTSIAADYNEITVDCLVSGLGTGTNWTFGTIAGINNAAGTTWNFPSVTTPASGTTLGYYGYMFPTNSATGWTGLADFWFAITSVNKSLVAIGSNLATSTAYAPVGASTSGTSAGVAISISASSGTAVAPADAPASGAGVAATITINETSGTAAPASGVGVAPTVSTIPVVSVAPLAAQGSGVGVVPTPTTSVAPLASPGTGAGVAATVTTADSDAPPAATATGVGVTPAVAVAIEPSAAVGSGAGSTPTLTISVGPLAAPGTGVGVNPSVSTSGTRSVSPLAAVGSGVGTAATITVGAVPLAAPGSGTGTNSTVTVGTTSNASVGSGTGAAPSTTVAVSPLSAFGSGVGIGSVIIFPLPPGYININISPTSTVSLSIVTVFPTITVFVSTVGTIAQVVTLIPTVRASVSAVGSITVSISTA